MRMIVCGGRDYNQRDCVFAALNMAHDKYKIECIIAGGARGADTLAVEWAKINKIAYHIYYADWHGHRKAAGPIRNRKMLNEAKADGVIAFPGGAGTADMIAISKTSGLLVWQPYG